MASKDAHSISSADKDDGIVEWNDILDCIKKFHTYIDNKSRNLEKRKNRLLTLVQVAGKELNDDQKSAVSKLEFINGNIETLKDIKEYVESLNSDFKKVKKPREEKVVIVKEPATPPPVPVAKPDNSIKIMRYRAVIDSYGNHMREFFANGSYGANQLSEDELNKLEAFIEAVGDNDAFDDCVNFEQRCEDLQAHFVLLGDESKDKFMPKCTYAQIAKIFDKILNSPIFSDPELSFPEVVKSESEMEPEPEPEQMHIRENPASIDNAIHVPLSNTNIDTAIPNTTAPVMSIDDDATEYYIATTEFTSNTSSEAPITAYTNSIDMHSSQSANTIPALREQVPIVLQPYEVLDCVQPSKYHSSQAVFPQQPTYASLLSAGAQPQSSHSADTLSFPGINSTDVVSSSVDEGYDFLNESEISASKGQKQPLSQDTVDNASKLERPVTYQTSKNPNVYVTTNPPSDKKPQYDNYHPDSNNFSASSTQGYKSANKQTGQASVGQKNYSRQHPQSKNTSTQPGRGHGGSNTSSSGQTSNYYKK